MAWTARNSRRRLVTDPASGHVREFLDPPAVAVRELISNALVHRDLAEWSTSRSIECRLTPDAFRLTNPGGLYGVTADRLGVHPLTSARNRRLVDICKFIRTDDGNVVEALASGIPAALAAVRDAGMPDLDFYDQGITFTVTIRRQSAIRAPSPTEPSRRIGPEQSELLELLTTPKTRRRARRAAGDHCQRRTQTADVTALGRPRDPTRRARTPHHLRAIALNRQRTVARLCRYTRRPLNTNTSREDRGDHPGGGGPRREHQLVA